MCSTEVAKVANTDIKEFAAKEKLEIVLSDIFKQTPPKRKKTKKIITGRSVMVARMLWEHLARVRISAARQKNKRMSRV